MGNTQSEQPSDVEKEVGQNRNLPPSDHDIADFYPVHNNDQQNQSSAVNIENGYPKKSAAIPTLDRNDFMWSDGTINLAALPKVIAEELKFLDTDGDGTIDVEEIRSLVRKNEKNRNEKRIYRGIFIGALVGWLATIAVIGACVYLIVERTKESHVKDSILTTAGNSREPVQCANTDMVVKNGVMQPRSSPANAPQNTSRLLSNSAGDALGVRNEYKQVTISSTLPDRFFKELEWFEILSSSGLKLSFKVLGLSRFLTKEAKCGTLLKVVTAAGVLVIDDQDIYYEEDLFSLFSEAGFHDRNHLDTPAQANSANRKLYGRKLQSSDGVTITMVGFFNAIDEYDWKCESVKKPNIPDTYYVKGNYLYSCLANGCEFRALNDVNVPHYGLTAVDDQQYLFEGREMFIESDGSNHVIRRPSYHPGVMTITSFIPNGDGSTRTRREFQISDDGTYSHCYIDASSASSGAEFPSNFIFYPLDEGEPNSKTYRYRISMKRNDPEAIRQMLAHHGLPVPEWDHIDYFENRDTKTPAKVISADGSIFNIDEFKSGDKQVKFSSRVTFDSKKFDKCLTVSNAWENREFDEKKELFSNKTFTENLSKTNSSASLVKLYRAWDWSEPYPPLIRASKSFDADDMKYYMSKKDTAKNFPLWANYVQKYYAKIFPEEALRHVNVTNTRNLMMQAMKSDPHYDGWTIVHEDELSDDFKYHALVREQDVVFHHAHNQEVHHLDDEADRSVDVHGRELISGSYTLTGGIVLAYDTAVPRFNMYYRNGNFGNVDISLNLGNNQLVFSADCNGCFRSTLCLAGNIYYSTGNPLSAASSSSRAAGSVRVYVDLNSLLPGWIKAFCSSCSFQFDLFTASFGPSLSMGPASTITTSASSYPACGSRSLIVSHKAVMEESIFPDKNSIPIPIPIAAISSILRGRASMYTKTRKAAAIGGYVNIAYADTRQSTGDFAYSSYTNYNNALGAACLSSIFNSASKPMYIAQQGAVNAPKTTSLIITLGLEYYSCSLWSGCSWSALGSPVEVVNKLLT